MRQKKFIFLILVISVVVTGGCRSALERARQSKALLMGQQFARKGVVAMESGQWTEAERLLAKAVEESPDDPESRRHYAEALWKRGEKEAAIRHLEQAVGSGGGYEHHARLAQMYLDTQQIDKATHHADRAIDLQPEKPEGWAVRARILDRQKLDHDALIAYQRARGLAPSDRALLWDMARLYERLNRARDSLAVMQDLSNTYTPGEESQEVLYCMGRICASLGRSDEATDYYVDALRRGPATPDILYHMADAQYRLGNLAKSQDILHQALALDPEHQPSRRMLAESNPGSYSPQTPPSQVATRPGEPQNR